MSKTRLISGFLIVTTLVVVGTWTYWNYLAPEAPPPTPTAAGESEPSSPTTISAEGKVVPAYYAHIGFNTAGVIDEVYVQNGELVQADQLLATLENREQLDAAVATAELELLSAQQALDSLYENADVSEALAAKAVADGRDSVHNAERRLNGLQNPASQETIDSAQSAVELAEKALRRAQKDLKPYLNKPMDNPRRLAAELLVSILKKQYESEVRRLNYLQGTANETTIAQAEADLDLARAQLDDAERQLDELDSGLDPDQISLAKARVDNAAAQLLAARQAVKNLELRAPFSGTVISTNLKAGEFAPPGSSLITLADISHWQIETTDLSETDVSLLEVGMPASITIDAFPGETFSGQITLIDFRGEEQRGDVVYKITLSFDHRGEPLRWGMTAFVNITRPQHQ